jgi:hypothetical protein
LPAKANTVVPRETLLVAQHRIKLVAADGKGVDLRLATGVPFKRVEDSSPSFGG